MTPCNKITCTLTSLFGYSFSDAQYDYSRAAVFRRSDMPSLLCELQGLKQAGKPLVAFRTLEVQRNTWWGIEGGFSVKLAVVVLDKSTDFESRLAADTRDALSTNDALSSHPRYGTHWYLEHPILGLLAAQSEYSV